MTTDAPTYTSSVPGNRDVFAALMAAGGKGLTSAEVALAFLGRVHRSAVELEMARGVVRRMRYRGVSPGWTVESTHPGSPRTRYVLVRLATRTKMDVPAPAPRRLADEFGILAYPHTIGCGFDGVGQTVSVPYVPSLHGGRA